MIEIYHEMVRYFVHINEIFCCDCYFDEIYYLLRKKKNFDCFEKKFSEEESCYFDVVFGSAIIVCYDFLRFSKEKNNLSKSLCIETILSQYIQLCSMCTIEVFKKTDDIIKFRLRW